MTRTRILPFKMKLPLYQIDAFASEVFQGNPAAVIPLDEWLPEETMQSIAMENQLSETAFFVPEGNGFGLRWFTPTTEVDLCGHATLATAQVLFEELDHKDSEVSFSTKSGILTVVKAERGYTMDFPGDKPMRDDSSLTVLSAALGCSVREVWRGRVDLVAVIDTEETIRSLDPDFRLLAGIESRGVLVTARGVTSDFVSRCFFPRFGIDEDPVTGSAHATLAPLWGEKLKIAELSAAQISRRGGEIRCVLVGDRVHLTGSAVTFLRGEITL